MDNIKSKMAKGAAWMILFKFAQRGLGLISTIILARLLVPDDFGLVAIAMSIFTILEIMGSFSFDLALIQNQGATRDHYNTAWTLKVIYGVFAAITLCLLAESVAHFFNDPRLDDIIYFFSLGALFQGFENIGVVAFRKELNFRKEFKFMLAKKLLAFSVTIVLAFIYKNYWALVAGMLTSQIGGVLISYGMHPYRPRFSLRLAKELLHFSKWLLLNNVMIFLNTRGIDLLIGKMTGTRSLGYYTIAYEISNLPTTELVHPISRAIFPGYAKMSSSLDRLREGFIEVFSFLAMFVLPIGMGIVILAEPLIIVILGDNWIATIPLVQALAISGIARALQANSGAVYLVCGTPRTLAFLTMLQIILTYPALVMMLDSSGIEEAVWVIVFATFLTMPVNFFILMRRLSFGPMELVKSLWRPILSTFAMFFLERQALEAWPLSSHSLVLLLQLLAFIALGVIVYSVSILALWRLVSCPSTAPETMLINVLRKLYDQRSSQKQHF